MLNRLKLLNQLKVYLGRIKKLLKENAALIRPKVLIQLKVLIRLNRGLNRSKLLNQLKVYLVRIEMRS